MDANPSILALDEATYGWAGRPLLSSITLALEPGGFYFLTGPSGAGKTTFLRLCYADLLADSGAVTLFGRSTRDLDRDGVARLRQRVGVIHQDCRFLDHLSVRENVTLPLAVAGKPSDGIGTNTDELLKWVGLTNRQDALPPELSGGERQRAALARAVVASPDLILADEPTGNIDWDMSERILSLLVQLNRQGKTVLVATHDLPLIRSAKAQVAVRVMRLTEGRIVVAGADT